MGKSAKAWVAGAALFVTALLVEWTGPEDPLTVYDFVVAGAAALVGFGVTWGVPNEPEEIPPVPAAPPRPPRSRRVN